MPLLGERVDSHRFLPQVMDHGAAAVLTSQELMLPEGRGRLRRDPVEDTKKALQKIGSYLRDRLTPAAGGRSRKRGKDHNQGDDRRRPVGQIPCL